MPSSPPGGILRADDRSAAPARGPEGHPGSGQLPRARLRGPRGGVEETRRTADDRDGPRERAPALEAHAPRAPREAADGRAREADRRGPQVDLLRAHGPREEDPPPGAG